MSIRLAWALVLAGMFGVAMSPDAASAQRIRVVTVDVSPADAQVAIGQRQVFLANAYDAANNPIASATFTFSSSNVNIATVDANGIATGLRAGTVIITARTGSGAVAKAARATLSVVQAGVAGVAAQAAPATPRPATAALAVDCSSASTGALNPNRSCYDLRPVPRAPLMAVAPESCTDPVTPAALLVHVSAQGEVIEVQSVRGSSSCAAFAAAASVYVRDLAFVPAQLQGTAVAAWTNVLVRPAPPGLREVLKRPVGPGTAALDRQPEGSGPPVGLSVRPLRVVLGRGESRQLEYRALNAAGGNAERVSVVFAVVTGGERIVTVDSVGLIRAVGDTGVAVVRVEAPGRKDIMPRMVSVEVRADSVRSAPVPPHRPPE